MRGQVIKSDSVFWFRFLNHYFRGNLLNHIKNTKTCQIRTDSDCISFTAYKVKLIKIDCDFCKPAIQVRFTSKMATQAQLAKLF